MASTSTPKAVTEGGSDVISKLPPCGFLVKSNKKGAVPISIEKRPKGKKVTIISNVQGSAPNLLSALSTLLGSGGTVRQESSGCHWTVELQGDQSERITSALVQLGCVQGLRKPVEDREKKKTVEVVSRVCAYDKFLRKSDDRAKSRTRAEAFANDACLPDADCSKWHGAWFYCRGRCTQSDMIDVWEESLDDRQDGYGRSLSSSARPKPPASSVAELNITLRDLGLLPVVGGAHRPQRLTRNPASGGMSLADYRKAAIAPGARLITEEPNPKTARRGVSRPRVEKNHCSGSSERSKSLGTSRPSRPAKPPPTAKVGTYSCPLCHCVFGLQKTWKLHMETVHGGSYSPMKASMQKLTAPPVETQKSIPGLLLIKPKTPPAKVPKQSLTKVAQKQPKVAKSAKTSELSASGRHEERTLPTPAEMYEEALNEHDTVSNDSDNEGIKEASSDRAVLKSCISVGECCKVTDAFEPTEEGCDVQLRVKVGELVNVCWVPEDDDSERYWAYVSTVSGNAEMQGYVPLHLLESVRTTALQPAPTENGVSLFSEDISDMESVPVEWLEGLLLLDLSDMRSAKFWSKFNYLRLSESLQDAWCLAMEEILLGEAPPIADTGVETKRETSQRRELAGVSERSRPPSEEKNYGEDFPALQQCNVTHPERFEERKGGNRWNTSSKRAPASANKDGQHQISSAEPCPVCGVSFSPSVLESHIGSCISKFEAAHSSTPCPDDQCSDSRLSTENHAWARKKLKDLVDRFCMTSRLDIEVALASLIACRSANEMRNEAVALIFDSQPVKNFAADLWRRKSGK